MSINSASLRSGTTDQWDETDPVLAEGEPGLDTTTETFKVGDGTSHWSALSGYRLQNLPTGTYDDPFTMNGNYVWVSDAGDLTIGGTAPEDDTDGTVVGTQS